MTNTPELTKKLPIGGPAASPTAETDAAEAWLAHVEAGRIGEGAGPSPFELDHIHNTRLSRGG